MIWVSDIEFEQPCRDACGRRTIRPESASRGSDHQHAIEAYCRDWELSGIIKSLPFAQKVNQTGHVLNLKPKRKFDEYM